RDASQPGTATLTAKGAQTEVVINIQPGPAGVQQLAHVHVGGCPGVGAVKYPLTLVVDGKSTSTVNASLGELLNGTYSINVHKSVVEAQVYVSCGNLTLTGATTGATPAPAPGRKRTIDVNAFDYYFDPGNLSIVAGETIVFNITEKGASTHNFKVEGPG